MPIVLTPRQPVPEPSADTFSVPGDMVKALGVLAAIAAPCIATSARAQPFRPNRWRIVTPFPPGSGPDAGLRLVAERLARQ